tara:strand:- start:518 stop:1447 length:930 start_codon:yes stop_codon:yes gene_type:complete
LDLKKLKYKDPILLSSTDGVGTKLKIAIESKILDYLGIDLVAMCVNDILANGGEPLFFLDYFSSSKISGDNFLKIIKSINNGCKQSGCSLIGGETAEMPGIYRGDDFDLAGFAVGVVERKKLLNVNNVKNGDILVGIKSSGIHSNGFSLIRKALKKNRIKVTSKLPFDSSKTIGEELLIPTKIYVNDLLPLIKKELINSIAHITGGGIFENLSRAVPKNLKGVINTKNFRIPKIFHWLKKLANISPQEMLSTFNCGVGVIIIIKKDNYKKVLDHLKKNKVKFYLLGEIENNSKKESNVVIRKFGEWNIT